MKEYWWEEYPKKEGHFFRNRISIDKGKTKTFFVVSYSTMVIWFIGFVWASKVFQAEWLSVMPGLGITSVTMIMLFIMNRKTIKVGEVEK